MLADLRTRQGTTPALAPWPRPWQRPRMAAVCLDDWRFGIVGREARVGDPTPQGLDPPGWPRGPIVGPLVPLVLVPTGHHTALVDRCIRQVWLGCGAQAATQNWFPPMSAVAALPLLPR